MDILRTIYSFSPEISIIMIIGVIIGIWGAIAGKNKRVFLCLLIVEGMYAVLVYLGMKYEYVGVMVFFALIVLLTVGIYIVQRNHEAKDSDER